MPETSEYPFTPRVTTRREAMTLPELARMLDALTALGEEVAVLRLAAEDRRYWHRLPEEWRWMPRFGDARYLEFKPRVLWVRNESPVTVALAETAQHAATLAAALWVLRNPSRITSWPWRAVSGYHEAAARARAMKMWAREVKDAAGGDVHISDLPAPPPWLFDPDDYPAMSDDPEDP